MRTFSPFRPSPWLLVAAEPTPGAPFDNGRFDVVVESLDAPEPTSPERHSLPRIRRPHAPAAS